jgi:DNA-binding transcriptional LysR family regulator
MPRRVARRFADRLDVVLLPPPLELDSFAVELVWHRRSAEDPAHRWFRDQIVETAGEMPTLDELRAE